LAHAGLAFPSYAEMTLWVNEVRPAGEPERTEGDIISAAKYADQLETVFRSQVHWWGG
jgi:hypothetical protein